MNADAFRHLFDYHFAENRKTWDYITRLSQEQFEQVADYSRGSVREQVIHLIDADDVWFSALQGMEVSTAQDPLDFTDREQIRAFADLVEQHMRAYLSELRDDMLADTPLEGEDKDVRVWQVLIHVVNHGTDHRAQLLRLLHDLGVETIYQDYIFYVYGHSLTE